MPTARRRPIGRPRRSSVASRCRRSSWNGSQAEAVRTPPAPGNRTPAAASEDGNRVVLKTKSNRSQIRNRVVLKLSAQQRVRLCESESVLLRTDSFCNRWWARQQPHECVRY